MTMKFRFFAENALQLYGPGNIEWKVEERYDRDAVVVYGRDRNSGEFACYEIGGLDQDQAWNANASLALLQHVVDTIENLLGKDHDEMGNNQGSSGNQGAPTLGQKAESLYARQNNPVREAGRTLMEMLNE